MPYFYAVLILSVSTLALLQRHDAAIAAPIAISGGAAASSAVNTITSHTLASKQSTPAPSPPTASSAPSAAHSTSTTPSGWGTLFQLKPGEWRCEVCSITNPKEADTKCLSCKNDKHGKSNMKESGPLMNAGTGGAVGMEGFTVGGTSSSSGADATTPSQHLTPSKK